MKTSAQKAKSERLGAILFLVVGLAALGAGIYFFINHFIYDSKCTQEVQAVVVDFSVREKGRTGHKHNTYAPVFEYEYEGKSYTYESTVSSRKMQYQRGQTVTVKIDPDNPSHAFDAKEGKALMTFGALGFGVVFAVLGIVLLKHSPKGNE